MIDRRVRAIVITALIWGTVWAVAGILFNLAQVMIHALQSGSSVSLLRLLPRLLPGGAFYSIIGGLCGATFAIIVARAEQQRTLDQLSGARMALWGGIGGALFPLPTVALLFMIGSLGLIPLHTLLPVLAIGSALSGILGASVAATHLNIARRLTAGPSGPREISGAG